MASRSCLPANHPVRPDHRNQQFSIIALTNGSGTITERYAYTAYGTPTITDATGTELTSSAHNNRYSYTGREWDLSLSLYHYRARMYDSTSGRFCSRDPIGYRGSEWNLFEYCRTNPLGYLDPTDLDWRQKCKCVGYLTAVIADVATATFSCTLCFIPGEALVIGDIAECVACAAVIAVAIPVIDAAQQACDQKYQDRLQDLEDKVLKLQEELDEIKGAIGL